MELCNIYEVINEFSNYLLSINNDLERKELINKVLQDNNKLIFIKLLRPEDENENKTITEKDENNNDVVIQEYSQINEFIKVFGLTDNEESRNKLKEYLDYFLTYKNQI